MIIYVISFFMMSLYSFNVYGTAVFCILGYFIFFVASYKYISLNIFGFIYMIIISASSIVAIYWYGDIKLSNALGFLLSISMLFFFDKRRFLLNDSIGDALKYVIYIHISIFYLQLFTFYIFGFNFDIMNIFGMESRNFDGSRYVFGLQVYRASGLFEEPSTYFSSIFLMLMPIYNKIKWKEMLLIILTGFLSFSTLSFILALLLFVGLLVRYGFFRNIALLVILIPIVIYVGKYQLERVFNVGIDDYDAIESRLDFVNLLIERDIGRVFFGEGVGTILFNPLVNNDLGGIVMLLYLFGFASIPFIFKILSTTRSTKIAVALLILKLPLYYPLFWVMVHFASSGNSKNENSFSNNKR